jgi:hypothetical protein
MSQTHTEFVGLGGSCNHRVFNANADSALAVGHSRTANGGQLDLDHALSANRANFSAALILLLP